MAGPETDGAVIVGFVLDRFDAGRGGLERESQQLLLDLAERGHTVRIYCREGRVDDPRLKLCTIRVGAGLRGQRERHFAERAVAAARESGADVVYAVRHVLDADLYHPHGGSWAATREGRERARPSPPLGRLARRLSTKQRYFAEADEAVFRNRPGLVTVAVSDWVAEDLQRRFARHEPEIHVVWPAVEPGRHASTQCLRLWTNADAATPRLLFVAHEPRLKGLEPLLAAMARQPFLRRTRLLVVGRRARQWRVRGSLARELSDRVTFHDPVADVASLMSSATLLVHPTFYDPCARVSLEALATGLPVVTTVHDGAATFVRRAGCVVDDPRDGAALAAAVEEVVERREELAARAPDVVVGLRPAFRTDAIERLLLRAAAGRPS